MTIAGEKMRRKEKTVSEFSKNTDILGVPAEKIARIIQAEGSIFVGKCYEGLLGIAQSMSDMTESGRFGTGLTRVLRYHFPSPEEDYHPECLRAVEDVFVKGKLRNPSWKILQIRPFAGYVDESGNPDPVKTEELRGKYCYLGKDGISEKRGRFYFGKKQTYRVKVGLYKLRSNAVRMQDYLRLLGYPCVIKAECDCYLVLAGSFLQKSDAENFAVKMKSGGYSLAEVRKDF